MYINLITTRFLAMFLVNKVELCNFRIPLITIKSCLHTNFIQRYNSNKEMDQINSIQGINKKSRMKMVHSPKEKKISSQIIKYLNDVNPKMLEICPPKYLMSKIKGLNTLYLVKSSTAEEFLKLIHEDLLENASFVAEGNPGLGLLTEQLLKTDIPIIHAYEENKSFHPSLNDLKNKYPNRLDIRQKNLFKSWIYKVIDEKTHSNITECLLADVPYKAWNDKTCMQVIGVVTDSSFITYQILNVVFQSCYMSRGRTLFYIAILPSTWLIFASTDGKRHVHRRKNFFLSLFFDYKLLGTLERAAFIPLQKKINKDNDLKSNDDKLLYVIKLEPKPDLFTKYINKEDIVHFWYFVQHSMATKNRRIIPELEKWIPGCGIRLIAKNYTIFTQFTDLSVFEFFDLFKEFSSWPEYKSSSFQNCVKINVRNVVMDKEFDFDTDYKVE